MSRETFEQSAPKGLLEPVNNKLDSAPPPEVHREAVQQEYEGVKSALDGLQVLLDYNAANSINTPRELRERFKKFHVREQKLAAQLGHSDEFGLFTQEPKQDRAATSRAA